MRNGYAQEVFEWPRHDNLKGKKPNISNCLQERHLVHSETRNLTWGSTIPTVEPGEALRYLGAKIGPWKGIHCGIIVPELLGTVRRVRKLSLKPCQKLEFIAKYIFPRYI
jgi:hypothetical protein